ncbi:MAG: glycine--tRNA ligase subunit beta [Clostridiales bacterium]|nr:glycine--tRNA ligase subunit beta [Clostridiales bacterium]
MSEYLLEIGTEEMPAHFIGKALEQMGQIVEGALAEQRIAFAAVRTMGTPRRLSMLIDGLALQGEDRTDEVRGPAQKAAYDGEGQPTKALQGFMNAQGVSQESLTVKEVNGNMYVYASRRQAGQLTKDVLPGILTDMVSALYFPKYMRWGDLDFRFARPVRWVASLLDDDVLPLTIAEVAAGRQSRGHRFLGSGDFDLAAAADYEAGLEAQYVLVDPAKRRARIWAQIEALAEANQCKVEPDEDLLDEVTFLLEWPTALIGGFNESYLEMPEEVLITPMREHQRYFPVRDKAGKLLNRFVTVRDGGDRALGLVAEGNEKVLAARLADARFFWDEDRKQPLEAFLPKLERVVFQEKLGTVGDKIRRIEQLTDWLAGTLKADAATRENALRGAKLAKADLASSMVFEFAELQGIMGRYYALACGEKPEAAQVILEHYQPRFAGDAPAGSLEGAFVAIADKVDTIAGIFAIGVEPTGSQDPYALRRAAMGVCQTILARDLPIDLVSLVMQALGQYMHVLADEDGASAVLARIIEFFEARIRAVLSDEGHRYDVVDCVMGSPFIRIQEVMERAAAVSKRREHEDFRSLVAGFTRANNLTKKAEEAKVDPALFTEEAEMALHARVLATQKAIDGVMETEGVEGVILALANLSGPINAFFDGVMVMAEDMQVRANRLGLLSAVVDLTRRVGDLSKLQD